MKNVFQTISYRGEYIQTCRDDGKEIIKWNGREFCSVKNAKIAIGIHLKVKELNPHPKIDKFGFFNNYFLFCNKDGILKVKDGKTLEEYLNNKYFIKNRKEFMKSRNKKKQEYIMIPAYLYEQLNIPHSA